MRLRGRAKDPRDPGIRVLELGPRGQRLGAVEDPVQGLDALAVQDHGTHTAGIAAGVTGKTAVVNGVNIDDMSG